MFNIPMRVLLGYILIFLALLALPFLTGLTLGNSWVRTLDFALLYIMLALGLKDRKSVV